MILHWVWLMPAIMAASFVAILAFGKRLPRKGSEIGIAAVGLCFVIAIFSAGTWISHVNDAAPRGRAARADHSGGRERHERTGRR